MPSRPNVSKKRDEVNCVPLSVVSVNVILAAALRQPFEYRLLDRCERVFGPAAMREIPSHDLPRAAVDHITR